MNMSMSMSMSMLMTVVPKFSLVQQKEKDQTHQQGHEQMTWRRARAKRFGQQMQKSRRQKRSSGQAEHVLLKSAQQRFGQNKGDKDTAHTTHEGTENNSHQSQIHCHLKTSKSKHIQTKTFELKATL
jgi:hypothetical protein